MKTEEKKAEKNEPIATPKKQFRPPLNPELQAPLRQYAGNHNLRSVTAAIEEIVRAQLRKDGLLGMVGGGEG